VPNLVTIVLAGGSWNNNIFKLGCCLFLREKSLSTAEPGTPVLTLNNDSANSFVLPHFSLCSKIKKGVSVKYLKSFAY
jgi:hypothetical protein